MGDATIPPGPLAGNHSDVRASGTPARTLAPVKLLGPKEIRALAAKLDVTPTKKLGQNFLHDPNTVRMIVSSAQMCGDDDVLEVGPGLGSLTLGLLDVARSVSVVEIDTRLANQLPHTVAEMAPAASSQLSVVNVDALKLQRADLGVAPTVLAANLPYNVAVPVLMHILGQFPSIRRVLVMVQKEVADRLAAQPGNKIYGAPSVKARYYGSVARVATIGKNVFWPAPRVSSGLVGMDCYDDPAKQWGAAATEVFPIIDAAFAQRRKTLRGALASVCGSAATAEEVLRAAGIDPTARGEQLSIEQFVAVARARGDLR